MNDINLPRNPIIFVLNNLDINNIKININPDSLKQYFTIQNQEPNFNHSNHFNQNTIYLNYIDNIVYLCKIGEKGRVCVDFSGGTSSYRRTKGGGELIAKAVNHTSNPRPIVWDLTGGLGRDAFVLASLGLNIRVFEQNPAVFCLLSNGLERGKQDSEIQSIINNIELHFGNACQEIPKLFNLNNHLEQLEKPDVIYLDPMYPERQKSAAVKKEMAYFHELINNNIDNNQDINPDKELLDCARQFAKKRIVVKRPRLGEFLCGEKPAYQYSGKSTRFDVYLPYSNHEIINK